MLPKFLNFDGMICGIILLQGYTVSELLGHSDMTMTLRYEYLAPKHNSNAVEKLAVKYTENNKEDHGITKKVDNVLIP